MWVRDEICVTQALSALPTQLLARHKLGRNKKRKRKQVILRMDVTGDRDTGWIDLSVMAFWEVSGRRLIFAGEMEAGNKG